VSLHLSAQLIFFFRIFSLLHRSVLHRFLCRLFPVGEEICLPCLGFLFRFGLVLLRAGAVYTRFAISAERLLTVFCSGVLLFWIRF
jgi:hypothetical protein